jgi:hypothetical protein
MRRGIGNALTVDGCSGSNRPSDRKVRGMDTASREEQGYTESAAAAPAYEPPTLTTLGAIAELTQSQPPISV